MGRAEVSCFPRKSEKAGRMKETSAQVLCVSSLQTCLLFALLLLFLSFQLESVTGDEGRITDGEWKYTKREWWGDDADPRVEQLHPIRGLHNRCCKEHSGPKASSWRSYRRCATNTIARKRLRYVGPGSGGSPSELRELMSEKRIVMIGDSIMEQWFESLVCFIDVDWGGWINLANFSANDKATIEEIVGAVPLFPSGAVGCACVDVDKKLNTWENHRAIGLRNQTQGSKERGTVKTGQLCYYSQNTITPDHIDKILKHYEGKADLIILDLGTVHFNHKTIDYLRPRVEQCIRSCKAYGHRCVLKEATPQHFFVWDEKREDYGWTDGVYPFDRPIPQHNATRFPQNETEKEHRKCRQGLVNKYRPSAEFRNDVLRDIAEKEGLSMIAAFDALMPRGDMHIGKDCTHFSFDLTIWEPLHLQLLEQLKKLNSSF